MADGSPFRGRPLRAVRVGSAPRRPLRSPEGGGLTNGLDLRLLRRASGISAAEIARYLGVSRQRVWALERGSLSAEAERRYRVAFRAAEIARGLYPETVGLALEPTAYPGWQALPVAGLGYSEAARLARAWLRRRGSSPIRVRLAVAGWEETQAVLDELTRANILAIPGRLLQGGEWRPIRRHRLGPAGAVVRPP